MTSENELYKEIILEHNRNPSHSQPVSQADVSESGVNRSCGDEVDVELKVQDGRIEDICTMCRGCSIHTASGSLMAEAVEGMSLEQVEELIQKFKSMVVEKEDVEFPADHEDLHALSGVCRYPIRVKCATLSWNTLEQALKKYRKE